MRPVDGLGQPRAVLFGGPYADEGRVLDSAWLKDGDPYPMPDAMRFLEVREDTGGDVLPLLHEYVRVWRDPYTGPDHYDANEGWYVYLQTVALP